MSFGLWCIRRLPGETFGFDCSFAGAEGRRADCHAVRPRIGLVLDILFVTIGTVALAEIGDKTQIATVALAARFDAWWLVTAGTTIGMMLANVPIVLFGDRIVGRVPPVLARVAAACLFGFIGLLTFAGLSGVD